jgi:hypothetical protein
VLFNYTVKLETHRPLVDYCTKHGVRYVWNKAI